jgi:hypothetical protein
MNIKVTIPRSLSFSTVNPMRQKYRVTIKEIDTFNVIKTVSVADTQFA